MEKFSKISIVLNIQSVKNFGAYQNWKYFMLWNVSIFGHFEKQIFLTWWMVVNQKKTWLGYENCKTSRARIPVRTGSERHPLHDEDKSGYNPRLFPGCLCLNSRDVSGTGTEWTQACGLRKNSSSWDRALTFSLQKTVLGVVEAR